MRKKVLYVFGGEKAQGAEIVIERLINSNLSNVEAHLFVSPGNFASQLLQANKSYAINLVDDLQKLNRSSTGKFNFYLRAVKNYFQVSYKVFKYIKEHDIKIIHSNTIVPTSYIVPLLLFTRVFLPRTKFLWSDHDLSYYSKLDTILSKCCVNLFDKTLVVSEAVKAKYRGAKKVRVLYNGLDTSFFNANLVARNSFRTKHNIAAGTIVFGMAAVVAPRKGQLELIEVFNKVSLKFNNIQLMLAGGFADDTPEYTEKVKASFNTETVKHIGYINDVVAFYNGCDIIVSNSTNKGSEPLGTSIYEAMACEKVVIASNTGGTPEIITDNEDGFLFPAENLIELEHKISYALENYQSLSRIRSSARQKVFDRFDIRRMVGEYNAILQQADSKK